MVKGRKKVKSGVGSDLTVKEVVITVLSLIVAIAITFYGIKVVISLD